MIYTLTAARLAKFCYALDSEIASMAPSHYVVILIRIGSAFGLDMKLVLQRVAQSGKVRCPSRAVLLNETRVAASVRVSQRHTSLPLSNDDLHFELHNVVQITLPVSKN
jgi:hypothetical protein